MTNDIVTWLLQNGDTKVLIIIMAFSMRALGLKVDLLVSRMAEIHTDFARQMERNDATQTRATKNEQDILVLRDRHHDLVNNHIVKIESNSIMIEELKKKLKP